MTMEAGDLISVWKYFSRYRSSVALSSRQLLLLLALQTCVVQAENALSLADDDYLDH